MPYLRQSLYQSAALSWQQLTLRDAHCAWSDPYFVASGRLAIPLNHGFSCDVAGRVRFCDPFMAIWLTPERAYRLRHIRCEQTLAVIAADLPQQRVREIRVPMQTQLQLRRWSAECRTGRMEELQVEENCFAFLEHVLEMQLAAPPKISRAVERTREYLAHNACRREALTQIAAAVHCSPFHLARAFRRQTGQTIHAYRTGLRMVRALDRLQQGERDIAALAADLGYSSHSHFSQAFRRCAGAAPAQVRKNLTAAEVQQ